MNVAGVGAMWALAWGWLFALLIAPSSATKAISAEQILALHEHDATVGPIEKVIELLGVLTKDLVKEGRDDSAAHAKYSALNANETSHYKTIAEVNNLRKSMLANKIKQAVVNTDTETQRMLDLATKQTKLEMEQTADKEGRKAERKAFEKSQAITTESLGAIDRAIKKLSKKNPHAAKAATKEPIVTEQPKGPKSMLQFATQFEHTVEVGALSLSASQRLTLEDFMRSAKASEGDSSHESTDVEESDSSLQSTDVEDIIAPSFLQHSSRLRGVSLVQGRHKAQGVTGIIATLMSLRRKVKAERDEATSKETKDSKASAKFQILVQADIESTIFAKSQATKAIQEYKAEASKGTEDLNEAKRLYISSVKILETLAKTLKLRTEAYRDRLRKRSDENLAITEAKNILGAEIVQTYINANARHSHKKVAPAPAPAPAVLGVAQSFLQLNQDKKRDPFEAVKIMIVDMLKKLRKLQADELAKAAFCAREMAQNRLMMKNRGWDIKRLEGRLEALAVAILELKRQIKSLTKDLIDMKTANATATAIRNEEAPKVVEKLQTYKSATALMTKAIATLKKYYNKKAGVGSKGSTKGSNARHSMGAGVIGILEIAAADYDKLAKSTKEAEETAQRDYKNMLESNQISAAQFTKTLEYKKADLIKQETQKLEWEADLAAFKAELANTAAALKALEGECFKKAPTYAEMRAKQMAELAALREAQGYLSDEFRAGR